MMLPTSLPPNRSPIWQVFNPGVTQEDWMFRILSRYSREIASVFRYSTAVASSLTNRPSDVFSRWNDQGMKAVKPPGLLLNLAHDVEVIHALLDGFAAAEHHGRRGAHPQRVRRAVHVDPILR